jgi:Viral BACON domain
MNPAIDLTLSGQPGGPFNPSSQSYALTNSGSTSLDWAVGYGASWLDASATSGTLLPGSDTTLALSLNSEANNLPLGIYDVTLSFTNLNDGSVQSRLFALAVFGPPVVIAAPSVRRCRLGARRPLRCWLPATGC